MLQYKPLVFMSSGLGREINENRKLWSYSVGANKAEVTLVILECRILHSSAACSVQIIANDGWYLVKYEQQFEDEEMLAIILYL